ncbi:MAG: radical SAM family heme chaperone HemW [Porticoccaceae bacterium]|nr:radical SAM family heme chaperone HemW [Porticoccaceae bacterium]
MLVLPPLSLYVHIPWCVRKCPYCDFNSHEAKGDIPEADYVAALIADLQADLPQVQGRKLISIFFGGGTPSLFSPAAIGEILNAAEQRIGFAADIEITLEANPGTFEQARFRGYRSAGVNRLSIGIQSFNNQQLSALGRIHDRASAITAASSARNAGFDNFNLDLMHGLPDQSVNAALADLKLALDMNPTHLSWYQLTIEANTAFYKQPPSLPDEDILGDIQEQGHQLLTAAGFNHYEVSAYAQPERQSRHNLNYWQFGDYLGIGAGAHGKITQADSGHILRHSKTRAPANYLARSRETAGNFIASSTQIAPQELPLEFLMNALRLMDGVPFELFQQRTGVDFAVVAPQWQTLVTKGLLQPADKYLATTPLGFRFLNTVLGALAEVDSQSK